MRPLPTRRSLRIRRLNFARQLTREAENFRPDLDSLYLEPKDRLPFDPGVPHTVTLETGRHAIGRATCTCGGDTGWLPLWDAELRAHWHRREAEKATGQIPVRVGDRDRRAGGGQEAPMFDRTLFTKLTHRTNPEIIRTPPVVPLPILDAQQPILLVFDQRDLAIDLAYERHPQPGGTRVRSATQVSTEYWIPRLTPVFAVSEGVIVYARKHVDDHTIIVDHCNNWLSVYHRLEHMFVAPSDRVPRYETRVAAGDVLGFLAASPPGPLRSLRFELWKCDLQRDYQQMDPLRYIRRWRFLGEDGSP